MTARDRRPHANDLNGGEASPSPLKSRKLVDLMEGAPETGRKNPTTSCPRPNGPKTPPRTPPDGEDVSFSVEDPSASASTRPHQPTPPVPGGTPVRKSRPEPELPSEVCGILSVTPAGEGDTVAVTLSLPAHTAEELGVASREGKAYRAAAGRVKVRLYLLVEQYAEQGVRVGEATPETVRNIVEAGRLCAAIRRGMLLLEYGDQSARRLVSKLIAKGVDRETASRAAAYLTDRGYIREEDTATLRARQSVRKGWGPRRIREDLRAQGFTEEAADEAMEALDGEDWVENCAAVLSKKYGKIPDDRGERQKMIAALMRLGYDADTVREAMRMTARATARKK